MDSTVTTIVLLVLTAATALNLFLTVKLARIVRVPPEDPDTPFSVVAGEVLPYFEGRRLLGGEVVSAPQLRGQAVVLIFLSGMCSACRSHIPEFAGMLEPSSRAGVSLWIIDADGAGRIARLLAGSPLLERMLEVDAATRRRLNPRGGVPFYIFVDDRTVVQASNFVGDEDWQSFAEQMRETGAQLDSAS